jgi:hypothetical protein
VDSQLRRTFESPTVEQVIPPCDCIDKKTILSQNEPEKERELTSSPPQPNKHISAPSSQTLPDVGTEELECRSMPEIGSSDLELVTDDEIYIRYVRVAPHLQVYDAGGNGDCAPLCLAAFLRVHQCVSNKSNQR